MAKSASSKPSKAAWARRQRGIRSGYCRQKGHYQNDCQRKKDGYAQVPRPVRKVKVSEDDIGGDLNSQFQDL